KMNSGGIMLGGSFFSARNISAVYVDRTISISQCQLWFQKFRVGNYSLEDDPRHRKSDEPDESVLQALVISNPTITVEDQT
ncbi:hypothetical protein AVEN_111146-1, partial [Araneus ventricosus]